MYKLTILQIYKSMICFLGNYYHKTQSDDLGSLLGGMQLLEDESDTWDSAAWEDWVDVLGTDKKFLSSIEGFKAVLSFLKMRYNRSLRRSIDIKSLIDNMDLGQNTVTWDNWLRCIKMVLKNNPS